MALSTVAAVKTLLGISDTSQDAALTIFLAAADAAIKRSIGRDIEQANYTEFYSGDGSEFLCLRQFPVTAITSIHLDDSGQFGFGSGAFAAATLLVAGTDYALMRQSATLGSLNGIVRKIGGVWPQPSARLQGLMTSVAGSAIGNLQVVYTAGYASVPADLAMACAQLTMRLLNTAKLGGAAQSMSYEDASVAFFGSAEAMAFMGSIESTLRNYRQEVV